MQNSLPDIELPEYAKDLKLNLSNLLRPGGAPGLSDEQRDGCIVAAAHASRNRVLAEEMERFVSERVSPATLHGAKAAAAIMGMNNIYYRFVHLVGDDEYAKLPARLRMNVLRAPGVDAVDFELYSLVASAINGCGSCIKAHERALRKSGLGREAVQSGARIAAVVHAVAGVAEPAQAPPERDSARAA